MTSANRVLGCSRPGRVLLYGCVLGGFLVAFAVFFLAPVFLAGDTMRFFDYVPAISPIGVDLKQAMNSARGAFIAGAPYAKTDNLYPPMAYPLLAPLLLAGRGCRYPIITAVTLLAFFGAGWLFPRTAARGTAAEPLLMLVFASGLLSYGLQFELERGQFNVIAIALSFLGIWLFQRHPRFRFLGYAAFTVSVQLKLYPLLFILLLIDDWQDWKGNLRRVSLLGLVNLALLFVLGPGVLVDFVAAVWQQSGSQDWVWQGNHAIHGFAAWALRRPGSARPFIPALQAALTLLVIGLVVAVILRAVRRGASGIDAYLLAACSLGSLLIPTISNDYTLATLPGPVAFFFMEQQQEFGRGEVAGWKGLGRMGLLFLFSAAFASTLFSYTNKPGTVFLANMLPALVLMLGCVTGLAFLAAQPVPHDLRRV